MLKAVLRVSERVHRNAVRLLIFFDLSSSEWVPGSSVKCDHETESEVMNQPDTQPLLPLCIFYELKHRVVKSLLLLPEELLLIEDTREMSGAGLVGLKQDTSRLALVP